MKRLLEDLCYGIVGIGLLVGAVYWFCHAEFEFRQILMLVIGCALVFGCVFMIHQDMKNGTLFSKANKKIKEQWRCAARSKQKLPFAMLADNFCRLAVVDDMALAEPEYLSWNSDSFGEIRINKINATDWVCLFWVKCDVHLSDAKLRKICAAEGVVLPKSFLKMQAHGIAIYRDSVLSVFPALLSEDFKDSFLNTVMQSAPEFALWLNEYAD